MAAGERDAGSPGVPLAVTASWIVAVRAQESRRPDRLLARVGAPWAGTLDDPTGFLAGRWWQATLTQPGEPGADYGRWPFPVLAPGFPGAPRNCFVTARRR
jgi:hypothetical protein